MQQCRTNHASGVSRRPGRSCVAVMQQCRTNHASGVSRRPGSSHAAEMQQCRSTYPDGYSAPTRERHVRTVHQRRRASHGQRQQFRHRMDRADVHPGPTVVADGTVWKIATGDGDLIALDQSSGPHVDLTSPRTRTVAVRVTRKRRQPSSRRRQAGRLRIRRLKTTGWVALAQGRSRAGRDDRSGPHLDLRSAHNHADHSTPKSVVNAPDAFAAPTGSNGYSRLRSPTRATPLPTGPARRIRPALGERLRNGEVPVHAGSTRGSDRRGLGARGRRAHRV